MENSLIFQFKLFILGLFPSVASESFLIDEINKMETWATYIGNAYLDANILEKVYIIAGTEFDDREVHIIIVDKVLHALWYYGLWWNEMFSYCIIDRKFFIWNLEPDIWIWQNEDIYEYISVYANDLVILSRAPKILMYAL